LRSVGVVAAGVVVGLSGLLVGSVASISSSVVSVVSVISVISVVSSVISSVASVASSVLSASVSASGLNSLSSVVVSSVISSVASVASSVLSSSVASSLSFSSLRLVVDNLVESGSGDALNGGLVAGALLLLSSGDSGEGDGEQGDVVGLLDDIETLFLGVVGFQLLDVLDLTDGVESDLGSELVADSESDGSSLADSLEHHELEGLFFVQ